VKVKSLLLMATMAAPAAVAMGGVLRAATAA
jgi:hypothetical protein